MDRMVVHGYHGHQSDYVTHLMGTFLVGKSTNIGLNQWIYMILIEILQFRTSTQRISF